MVYKKRGSGPPHFDGKNYHMWQRRMAAFLHGRGQCRMDLPGPTTSMGTWTDYSVGPWDCPACAARYLMA
jgi:hypothetical protein